jgi:hypothetical protein
MTLRSAPRSSNCCPMLTPAGLMSSSSISSIASPATVASPLRHLSV